MGCNYVLPEGYNTFNYKDHWAPGMFTCYALITLLIKISYRISHMIEACHVEGWIPVWVKHTVGILLFTNMLALFLFLSLLCSRHALLLAVVLSAMGLAAISCVIPSCIIFYSIFKFVVVGRGCWSPIRKYTHNFLQLNGYHNSSYCSLETCCQQVLLLDEMVLTGFKTNQVT